MEVLFFLLEQFPEQPHHFPPKRSSVCVSRVTPIRPIPVPESGQPSQTSRMPLTAGAGVMPGEISPVANLGRGGSMLLFWAEGCLHIHLLTRTDWLQRTHEAYPGCKVCPPLSCVVRSASPGMPHERETPARSQTPIKSS